MFSMASDASHMLEAALEQMDDIIAGTKYTNGIYDIGSPVPQTGFGSVSVLQLIDELKVALMMVTDQEEREVLRNQVPETTANYVKDWLVRNSVNQTPVNNETYQERLARLEGDKESLVLQVSVLTDQVEAQGEKIRDLETCLEENQVKLNATEEMLQQELLSRTSLETQKLDLMTDVSNLKLKLVGMEKEQQECEEKQHKAEGLLQELRTLKNKVDELETEKSQYEWKLKATKTEIAQLQEQLALKDAEIERLQGQISMRNSTQIESAEREEVYRRRLKEKYQEVQRLKIGMDSLLAANEEKDRRIEELTLLLNQYLRIKDRMAAAHGSSEGILLGSSEEEFTSCLKRLSPLSNTPMEQIKSEMSSRGSSPIVVSPSSSQCMMDISSSNVRVSSEAHSPPHEEAYESKQQAYRMLSSSLEELQSGTVEKHVDKEAVEPVVDPEHVDKEAVEPVVDPENKTYLDNNKYQTLPGKFSRPKHNTEHEPTKAPTSQTQETEDNSRPNLRETEKSVDSTLSSTDVSPRSSGTESGLQSPISPECKKNSKGIKKFFGKLRRTHSGNLHPDELGAFEFRRGGLRATTGPYLARPKNMYHPNSNSNTPFAQWNTDQVCGWLEHLGLGLYVNLARQWVKSGHTLLTATPQDLEKELGFKHPLHRKKLQLSLRAISAKQEDKPGELDHTWVTRWLDDIGLPQYKDQFNEARVDGRMLQHLTVNDLLFMKVTSQLHHLSIKCAIHVLHVNKFNPNCLRRRPADENNISPSEVVQWSNHRVMEWLRSVDLAEYAPNLRGSGVHGGLIILEPRFNADTLAMLLNIPPQKTLLRRHLTTNFNLLIGSEAQREKREVMESSSYTPLTTTAKVRPKKLGFSHFGTLRKKKFDDSTDYICPMDTNQFSSNGTQKDYGGYKIISPISDRDVDNLEQVGQNS